MTLVLLLATAACALLGLWHPRKTLAAIALGYAAVGFVSFALWSLVFPRIQLLLH